MIPERWCAISLPVLFTALFLIIGLAFLPDTPGRAEPGVLYVAPGGDCGGVTPCYAIIQDAVDAAIGGDEVRIARGVYTGTTEIAFHNAALILKGGYTITNWTTPDPSLYPTILDGEGVFRPLHIMNSGPITVTGLVLHNGADSQGAGLYVNNSRVTFHDCVLSDNTTTGYGGGALVTQSDVGFTGCTFTSNSGHSGGGLYFVDSSGTFVGNTFTGNIVQYDGGGIYMREATASFDRTVLAGNTAGRFTGGFYLYYRSNASLRNTLITGNQSGSLGSGISIEGADAVLHQTTVAGNPGLDGIGIYVGVYYADISEVELRNTILVSQTTGIRVTQDNLVDMDGTLWGAGAWSNGQDWQVEGTLITGTVNLWADPLFVDPGAEDYHLQSGSPAVDAGINLTFAGVNTDLDGDPRPSAWGFDLGADEQLGPALVMSQFASQPMLNPGQTVTYTVEISSAGVSNVTGITLANSLPPEQLPLSVTTSQGTCVLVPGWGGGTACTLGDMPAGTGVVLEVTAQVTATLPGPLPWIMRVQSSVASAETTNETYTDTILQDCHARLNDDLFEYTIIQDAVDAAADPADVVKVSGTCLGAFARDDLYQQVHLTRTLTIQGGWSPDFSEWDPAQYPTSLDALGQGRGLYVSGDITPIIEWLNVTGGTAAGMGGSGWGDAGGGAYFSGGAPVVRHSAFYSNTAMSGGGAYINNSDATLENNLVAHNQASALHGAGVLVLNSTATVISNTISGNNAAGEGGGLFVVYSTAVISGNTIQGNTAGPWDEGGGVLAVGCGNILVQNNTIIANHAAAGGGIMLAGSDGQVIDNLIEYNHANNSGGGLYLNYNRAPTPPTLVTGNIIRHNFASTWGGGVATYYYEETTLDGNLILSNTGPMDATFWLFGGDVTLTNNIIADNRSTSSDRTFDIYGAEVRFIHNTLARNSGLDGIGVYIANAYEVPATVWFTNTIIVSHTVGISVTGTSTAYLEGTLWGNDTDWGGDGDIYTGTVNLWGDPGFVAPDVANYHISQGSTAIDQGLPTWVTQDIDGESRLWSPPPDIGADEFFVPLTGTAVTGQVFGIVGVTYTFTTTASPPDVILPLTFTWDAAGQMPITHTTFTLTDTAGFAWPEPGTYPLHVVVQNPGSAVTATHTIAICQPPEEVLIGGAAVGAVGETYWFTGTVSPPDTSLPQTFTWETAGQAPVTRLISGTMDTITYTWDAPGTYPVTLTAENVCGDSSVLHTFEAFRPPLVVQLSGPLSGRVGVGYTFTATTDPLGATLPLTFTWEVDGSVVAERLIDDTMDVMTFTWMEVGDHTMLVTAGNPGGSAQALHDLIIYQDPLNLTLYVPSIGFVGQPLTLTGSILPEDVSVPITFTWEVEGHEDIVHVTAALTDTVSYIWQVPGTYMVSLRAENQVGVVFTERLVEIWARTYLPSVLR